MIWVIALMAAVAFARIGTVGSIVMAFAAVVAFVMWIGALVKLARQHARV
ncbi:MAG TPA: hypothetical protein VJP81_06910 [Candidatus Dormibacteraeota bacterium]|nr:hypothetical protein [Candidatus Dormibacteraeota bacterium]